MVRRLIGVPVPPKERGREVNVNGGDTAVTQKMSTGTSPRATEMAVHLSAGWRRGGRCHEDKEKV